MYSQPIDRHHPGCIVMLVDQSLSMDDPMGGSTQHKSVLLAQAVNRLIANLVLQCQRGEEIRDYYKLGLIGYGGDARDVGPAWGGALAGQHLIPISVVADHELRMVSDVMPGTSDVSIDLPVWLEPKAAGGTPMTAAIDMAGAMVVEWANENLDSFPPIVVNVSDGEATDRDPRPIAAQLRDIHTNDGDLLFFNVNLSADAAPSIEYPSSPQNLPNEYAKTLFEMSSPLTPFMLAVARGMGWQGSDGARGFVFNADAARLSEFLDVGTRVSRVADR
jgi:hypothetical protein